MDHRCPHCGKTQKKTKFGQAMVARMTVECTHCRSLMHLNVHRVESIVVMLNFAAIIALATCAYWLHSRELALVAFAVAMAGAASLPLLERTYLRDWPRYAAPPQERNAGDG